MTMKTYQYLLLISLLATSCDRKPLDIGTPEVPGTPAFHVAAEVSSDVRDQASSIIFFLKEGDAAASYSANVTIDGKEIFPESKELDFSGESIARIYLPTILPGYCDAMVMVSDGRSEESINISFEEPVRFPTLDMSLEYDVKEGTYKLNVTRNPYGIHILAESSLYIIGSASYYIGSSANWSYDDPRTLRKTDTKIVTVETEVDCDREDSFCLADRDGEIKELTSSYMLSAIWREGGGSEDCYYYITGYEPVYYKVTKEDFSVSFDIETVPGVTPVLKNNISGCKVSGL